MTIENILAKVSKKLILKEPFYGFFLLGMNKQFSDSIPTAGVSKLNINTQLVINPSFFMNLEESHRLGLLKHELLHIALGHLVTRDNYPDGELFNIAADVELNQYIEPDNLPPGALLPSSFPELNLPLKVGTQEYYKILVVEKNKGDKMAPSLKSILQDADGLGTSAGDLHEIWKTFDELSDGEKKLIQEQIDYQIKQAVEASEKSRGTIPGELKEYIDSLYKKEAPKFNWKAYLRRFAGNSTTSFSITTKKKKSKRFPDFDGIKIRYKKHILVGVDVSGSVSTEELEEFFNEIYHIHKTGTKITVIQCDTRINHIEEYKPNMKINLYGRGGTSFDPVVDYYNSKKDKFTSLIYLTDGEAPNPTNKPRGKVLWVMSSVSRLNKELPGQVIKLN